ncbi:hypothetical protein AHAS_Ahas09G0053300 [Arachis hypogaea]
MEVVEEVSTSSPNTKKSSYKDSLLTPTGPSMEEHMGRLRGTVMKRHRTWRIGGTKILMIQSKTMLLLILAQLFLYQKTNLINGEDYSHALLGGPG